MQSKSPNGVKTFLRGLGVLSPEPPKPISAKEWLAYELKRQQLFALVTPDGKEESLRVSGKDADGFVGLDDTTGHRRISFASAAGLRGYLEKYRSQLPPPIRPANIGFQAYTKMLNAERPVEKKGVDLYQGRPRITSVSKVGGGVYLPDGLKKMEAIVVDWNKEKDPYLHAYLVSIAENLNRYAENGGNPTTLVIIRAIMEDIRKTFPYSHAMAKEGALDGEEWFSFNKKVTLGVIMKNQWCVCRHHALLFTAAIEFLQSKNLHPDIADSLKDVQARYLAEMMDLKMSDQYEDEISGHAYCGVAWKDHVVLVDPAGGLVATVPEVALLSEQRPGRLRYLYSAMRFMIDTCPERLRDQDTRLTLRWAKRNDELKSTVENACREARNRGIAQSVLAQL